MGRQPEVAPDGSPVPVYLALPLEPEFTPVLEALGRDRRGTVLDLGCGVGRLSNKLAARGFRVTGVDESAVMLSHLHPEVEPIHARLEELALGRDFDAVVLASHLVNVADATLRRMQLLAAAAHVQPTGAVFIQHWDPTHEEHLAETTAESGGVQIDLRVLQQRGDEFDGQVTYTVGAQSWKQAFTATILDDVALDAALSEVGLRRRQRLSAKWLVAERATP